MLQFTNNSCLLFDFVNIIHFKLFCRTGGTTAILRMVLALEQGATFCTACGSIKAGTTSFTREISFLVSSSIFSFYTASCPFQSAFFFLYLDFYSDLSNFQAFLGSSNVVGANLQKNLTKASLQGCLMSFPSQNSFVRLHVMLPV